MGRSESRQSAHPENEKISLILMRFLPFIFFLDCDLDPLSFELMSKFVFVFSLLLLYDFVLFYFVFFFFFPCALKFCRYFILLHFMDMFLNFKEFAHQGIFAEICRTLEYSSIHKHSSGSDNKIICT